MAERDRSNSMTIKFRAEMKAGLERLAEEKEMSQSAIIKQAVRELLARECVAA